MIKKNNKTVGFIYKNNQNIDKVYKGTDLVFEQGYTREQTGVPPITTTYQAIGKNLKDYKIYGNSIQGKLPSEYQQVEYIESTGTQYIDTGFIPTFNTKISADFKSNKVSGEPFTSLFGTQKSTDNGRFYCLFGTTNNVQINIPSSMADYIGLNDDGTYSSGGVGTFFTNNRTNYIMDISNKIIQIENKTWNLSSYYTDYVSPDYNLFILTRNSFGIADKNCSKGLLYSVKIWDDNTLIRNFIPCYRKSDNEIGMYDLVTNTFFTNAGTGVFLKGSNAPTPTTPIEIESVGEKTKNLFNYKTASTYKGSFDNNGVFHATDNDDKDKLIYKIQLYNNNTMVTNSTRDISITGTGTYCVTSPALIQSETTRIRLANKGKSIEFSINCNIDGSQFVGQYASIVFTVDDATVGASVISDIMFYVGNEPFDYEPYGYKIPLIVGSDNLATDFGFGWYSGVNQKFTISYDFKRCTAKIKPNTTYTISKKNASNRFVVITSELEIAPNVSYKRVVLAEQNTNRTQYTFTTREDENYLFFGYYRGTDETEIELAEEEIMIVEGSTAPSKYIPYYNETTNIYLDEPLRKVDEYSDYIDFVNGKVVRNIKEMDMSIITDWRKNNNYQFYRIGFVNTYGIRNDILMSNVFIYKTETFFGDNTFGISKTGNLWLQLPTTSTQNEDTIYTYLESIGAIMIGVLETPTEKSISLPNIPTIKGTTVIEIDTKIQPSSMYIKYKSK